MDLVSTNALADWLGRWGYLIVFVAPMLEILVPMIPGEITLVLAGYAVSRGRLDMAAAIIVAGAGAMAGVSISYSLGRAFGFPLVERYGQWIFLTTRHLQRVNRWFHHWGESLLIFGYFIPSVRHVVAFVAGASELQWRRFAVFVYPGGLLWGAVFIVIGYFVGPSFITFIETYYEWIGIGIGVVCVIVLVWFVVERWRQMRSQRR